MKNLRALIVDDEPLAREGLRLRLEQMDGVEVLGECKNGREALNAIVELEPDVVFLDIQMPGMSGFEVIRNIQQDDMPLIIFVTAYDEYAVEAFDMHAVDYLLKPLDDDRLKASVERARQHFDQQGAVSDKQRLLELVISITGKSEAAIEQMANSKAGIPAHVSRIAIKDGGETTLVQTRDIYWVDAAGDYMCIHTDDETHIMRITMNDLEQQLDPTVFQRIHRSTIVNLEKVVKVCSHMNGEFHLVLSNGNSVKMSRSYKDKVRHFF